MAELTAHPSSSGATTGEPSVTTGEASVRLLAKAPRQWWLPSFDRPNSPIILIVFLGLAMLLGGFIPIESDVLDLTWDHKLGMHLDASVAPSLHLFGTANFWLVAQLLSDLMFSLLLLSSIQGTEHLLAKANDTADLHSSAQRPRCDDLVGILIFLATYAIEIKAFQMQFMKSLIIVGLGISFMFWGATLMRIQILRRERLQASEYLVKLRRAVLGVIVLQCLALAYITLRLVYMGPILKDAVVQGPHPMELQGGCELVNSSYVDKYCEAGPSKVMACTTPTCLFGNMQYVEYTCNDHHLYGPMFKSAYAACRDALAATEIYATVMPLIGVARELPVAIILWELRRGAGGGGRDKRRTLLLLGDIASVCLVASLLLSLALFFVLQGGAFPFGFSRIQGVVTPIEYALLCSPIMAAFFYSSQVQRGLLKLVGQAEPDAFACFCSHDWGTDGEARSNHARVGVISAKLQASGLSTWFDSERMRGDINAAMTDGIDRSRIVLVFITRNYLSKAAGLGPRGQSDNCYAEFGYSVNRKGVERLIAVVMEPACRDPSQWQGAVGLRLGSCLYLDCSADVGSAAFEAGVESLKEEVRKRVGAAADEHGGGGGGTHQV